MTLEIIKEHATFDKYEFSSRGFYRMKGNDDWLPQELNSRYANIRYFDNKKNQYCSTNIHRAIATVFIGDIPKGYEVDHINKDTKDNSVENLRIVSMARNRQLRDNSFLKTMQKKPQTIKTTDSSGNVLYFISKTCAGKYFKISPASVYLACQQKYTNGCYNGIKYEITADTGVPIINSKKYQTVEEKNKARAERVREKRNAKKLSE